MRKGSKMSESQKNKISEAMTGRTQPLEVRRKISEAMDGRTRKPFSAEHCKNLSTSKTGKTQPHPGIPRTAQTRKKMSEARQGRPPATTETRKKMSATKQGIPYDEWEKFACEKRYCPKFNEACRESNRSKYGRRCFVCDKTEKANGQKLSVHHVDMDKAQGCESNWKLVPLCKHHHATSHNDELIARLGYLIKD